MISYIMRSLLFIIVFALVNSQARILSGHHGELAAFNRKPPNLPPPSPTSAPPSGVVAPLLLEMLKSYGRHATPPPPSPKPASPVIEMITCCTTRSSEQDTFWSLKNYGKKGLPPPSPKDAPPTHQLSGGGLAAATSKQSSANLLLSSG